nr:1-hydroxycarotenoid 3,4-desaturase CrtD [Maliponia aquimaris]
MAPATFDRRQVLVIGAGVGGLACALRLQAAGMQVTVLERHATPGGKMRTLPSAAGPVDAGPTVLTLRPVFEDLFAACGTRLSDHVTLIRQEVLARHFWTDGSTLDLYADPRRSALAVQDLCGKGARAEFERFWTETERLFDTFDGPMIRAAEPSQLTLAAEVLRQPSLLRAMAPRATLAQQLARRFSDPRLAQLFGRYATYVGGSPYEAPALLSLIWQAEARGVWYVAGGMHRLAEAMARLFTRLGGVLRTGCHVAGITVTDGAVRGVTLADGTRMSAPTVVFNGDPRALATGCLGPGVTRVARRTAKDARSLSAHVWSFAARTSGAPLKHHNVFFAADPRSEFRDLARGRMPAEPTLYVCAEDRGAEALPGGVERFEIILNAAPLTTARAIDPHEEAITCHRRTFRTLARFGLRFDPEPGPESLTTPEGFDHLFPATAGSLYGQSPHGLTAGLRRPRARTEVRGLYLVGGGAHPGAGVPMATLSARHAAEAISLDLALT